MDSENPISNFASVPEAREEVSVAAPTSAGTSNDIMSGQTTTTPMESENASKTRQSKSKKGKIGLKERTERKRKATHPPTSEMAIEAIKELKKRNGASFEAIHGYIEDHYGADMKRRRYHLNNFLITGVKKGVLEQLGESGAAGRFKIKGKKTAERGTAKKEKQITDKGTAKKEKQTAAKGIAKKKMQTADKGTAKKGKPITEKEAAKKKKENAVKGTAKKEKRQ